MIVQDGVVYVEASEILVWILCIVGIVALVFLIIVLVKLSGLIGQVKKLIGKNNDEIDRTLKALPETVENIKEISGEVNDAITDIKPAVEKCKKTVAKTADTIDAINNNVLNRALMLGNIGEVLLSIFEWAKTKFASKKSENKSGETLYNSWDDIDEDLEESDDKTE